MMAGEMDPRHLRDVLGQELLAGAEAAAGQDDLGGRMTPLSVTTPVTVPSSACWKPSTEVENRTWIFGSLSTASYMKSVMVLSSFQEWARRALWPKTNSPTLKSMQATSAKKSATAPETSVRRLVRGTSLSLLFLPKMSLAYCSGLSSIPRAPLKPGPGGADAPGREGGAAARLVRLFQQQDGDTLGRGHQGRHHAAPSGADDD